MSLSWKPGHAPRATKTGDFSLFHKYTYQIISDDLNPDNRRNWRGTLRSQAARRVRADPIDLTRPAC
jgi:hypothetical protein